MECAGQRSYMGRWHGGGHGGYIITLLTQWGQSGAKTKPLAHRHVSKQNELSHHL